MFSKILIANRGEIAVRIIRACQEIGIYTVAVYSDADKSALHVRLADQAVRLGPAPAAESYLSIEKVLSAARDTGAQAIHPGYGFLSENADFAQAVVSAGLDFIGPAAESIRAMGDKAAARALMQQRGVPVVPGYQDLDDDTSLQRAAAEIGFPVLVKAAAGGGGKAMRVVREPRELGEALGAARREARAAFGDDRLILEKYILRARHIEFQVLGDEHGHLVHLFERECSVQRRHQKIIEETPSPLIDQPLREAMGQAAVQAARAVGYWNAGTVEFIVDPETREFYFLEMNTRLQVEHPITELTTGLDLVKWQLRIAGGEELPFSQSELGRRGHALECRIYAEDPASGFLPSTGCLQQVIEPRRPGVRVDSGFVTGDEITLHYDPLIAKLISHGEDRAGNISRMQAALSEYVILGIRHNIEFLQNVLAHDKFQRGEVTTGFVDEEMKRWTAPDQALTAKALIALALADSAAGSRPATSDTKEQEPFSPWAPGWYSRRP